MPNSFNSPRSNSMQLHFRKKSGKWAKSEVTIKESSDSKYLIEIHTSRRPVKRVIRKLNGSDEPLRLEISTHSHAIIRDLAEDKTCKLLSLVPLKKTKQHRKTLYQFAAYSEEECNDLDTLANSVEKSCDITSFEASLDAETSSHVPSGPASSHVPSGPVLLHIYKHYACLTSRSPCIKILHQWELIEPLAEFQWERYGFRISDHQDSNIDCFLFVSSQEVIKKIQRVLYIKCKKIYSSSLRDDRIHYPFTTTENETSGSHLSSSQISDHHAEYESVEINNNEMFNHDTLQVSQRKHSSSSMSRKELVEIRYPKANETTRRCYSDTAIKRQPSQETIVKSHSFHKETTNDTIHDLQMNLRTPNEFNTCDSLTNKDHQDSDEISQDLSLNDERDNEMDNSDISQFDLGKCYADVQLRPKFYMYMNVMRDDVPEPEVPYTSPYTYVNIFSGSSFKGCYENVKSSVFSTRPPPLPPKPYPPKLPPKPHFNEGRSNRPPPLPPKPRAIAPFIHNPHECTAPRIQVALFAANPVSGRVWFLRVAFMHQDENDTTFKRVKDIEAYSNHHLLKTHSLEVTSDITIEINVINSKQGFVFLNGNKQNIEKNDIEDLRKGDWFIMEFHIQNSDEDEHHLIGNVSIAPQVISGSCRRSCKADMGIDAIFQRKPSNASRLDRTVGQSLLEDYHQRQKLCRSLDVTILSQNHDWRQVAGSLGFTHAEIMELQDKACRSVTFSPTDEVLTIWERRDPNCNLNQLVNILRELGRLDVVQELGYSITLEG